MGVMALALLALAADAEPPWFFRSCPGSPVEGGTWRFAPGHDPARAHPEHPDGHWAERRLVPVLLGQGWFRREVALPEAWVGRPIGVFGTHVGAFELFVDGEPVAAAGPLEPAVQGDLPVRFGGLLGTFVPARTHPVLALRVVAPDKLGDSLFGGLSGVRLELCDPVSGTAAHTAYTTELQVLYAAFIGFCVALGVLHLLLHFAARDARSGHFDYALFTLATASLSAAVVARSLGGPLWGLRAWTYVFLVSLVLLSTFGVRFFAGAALGASSRLRYFALLGAVPPLVLLPWLSLQVAYGYSLLGLSLMTGCVFLMVRRRRPDRLLIAAGALAMVVASVVQMAPEALGIGIVSDRAYIYGFVVLLVAMALHLARSVGRTHQELAARVDEVERLSKANLAEQARAQTAALERVALEAENRQQAERLVEADRRAALLDELSAAHQRLEQTQAQLLQSEKMASLGQLVAGVAHEMNTPIGAIRSIHATLAKAVERIQTRLEAGAPALAGELRPALRVLSDATGVVATGSARITEIVQRLRTFARLDEAELQRVALVGSLEDALLLARHELRSGIRVVRELSELPPVACFPGQLNQVFLNLIINAKQAMGSEGTLTLRTRDLPDTIEVDVEDDGPGIPLELQRRIFDPGFTTKGVGVGTGLGLAICFRIVEAHHGSLRVRSAPGAGATFTMQLPKDLERRLRRAADEPSDRGDAPHQADELPHEHQRVLEVAGELPHEELERDHEHEQGPERLHPHGHEVGVQLGGDPVEHAEDHVGDEAREQAGEHQGKGDPEET